MKIIFFGTPEFSLPALEKLNSSCEVTAVFTQPDKPTGRGLKLQPPPVKKKALELGLKIYQLEKFDEAAFQIIKTLRADLGVVVAYGKLIPFPIISAFPKGIINYHPSLLPKYRGPAPIQRAILAGERTTGGTIIYLTEEMDAGDILWQKEIKIEKSDDYGSLSQRLSLLGVEGLLEVIKKIKKNDIKAVSQDPSQVTFAPKIKKNELKINWNDPAYHNWLKIKAFAPQPTAYCFYKNKKIKVYRANLAEGIGEPGKILIADPKAGIEVACKKGSLQLEIIKPEGSSLMSGADFVRGYHLKTGDSLD